MKFDYYFYFVNEEKKETIFFLQNMAKKEITYKKYLL